MSECCLLEDECSVDRVMGLNATTEYSALKECVKCFFVVHRLEISSVLLAWGGVDCCLGRRMLKEK